MKSVATAVRVSMVLVLFAVVSLWASPAHAQSPYSISFQITGPACESTTTPCIYNPYTGVSYAWGPAAATISKGVAEELSFKHYTDNSTAALMEAADSKQTFASAILQVVLQGTPTIIIQMDNVRIQSVREVTDNTDPNGPAEIVTLTFKSVDYTFQPVLPNGQRSGPSVSYSATFK